MNNRLAPMLKFGMIGILNTGIDFAVFTVLTLWDVPLLIAQCISYACGVLNSFIMNRTWTFQHRGQYTGQLIKFIAVNLLTLLITYGLMVLFNRYVGWSMLFSKLIATGMSLIVNFAGSRLWVFRETNQMKRSEVS
jgi:putative flippase GtrA